MRIGVETGDVVAALGREAAGLLTGGALHVASRLQSAASPGTIAVGERAWRDTRDAIAYGPLDDVEAPRPRGSLQDLARRRGPVVPGGRASPRACRSSGARTS